MGFQVQLGNLKSKQELGRKIAFPSTELGNLKNDTGFPRICHQVYRMDTSGV